MKEQKIYDHVRGLGHEPIEGTAIVVTRTPESVLKGVIEFATQELLVCCEDAVLLFRLDNLANGIRTSASYRRIAREDVLGASVGPADAGMTRRIRISTAGGDVVLNAQHEATSALRTSGLWGSWHATNLPHACEEISRIGDVAWTPQSWARSSSRAASPPGCSSPVGARRTAGTRRT